jgi:hypothetical protein
VDIVFLVCEHDHDFYDCQPQLVPVYGECGLINKLIPGGKVFPVSFIKEKYNGLLPVGAGEFAFDLFKITDGAEEKVGTFYNDAAGKVTAEDLKPGEYVFREKAAAYYPFEEFYTGWKFVWDAIYPGGADGLYFEITKDGVTWRDCPDLEIPKVNNKLWSKHSVFWTAEFYYGMDIKEMIELEDGSYITIFDSGFSEYLELNIQPADCHRPAFWRFNGDTDTSGGFELTVGEALGHDYVYDSEAWFYDYDLGEYVLLGEWYVCTRCGNLEFRPF